MPEAPDLQVILEYLEPRLTGRVVTGARETKPLVLRNLSGQAFGEDIAGRTVEKMRRHGKLLFLELSGERIVLINPMLTGGLRYVEPSEKIQATTHVIFDVEAEDGDRQLRYFDQKKMGMVYYLRPDQINDTPRVEEQGPDVLDEPMSLEGGTQLGRERFPCRLQSDYARARRKVPRADPASRSTGRFRAYRGVV